MNTPTPHLTLTFKEHVISTITAVDTKTVFVLLSIPTDQDGGVGAADWNVEFDNLGDFGDRDRRYLLTVPADTTPEALTEAMEAILGGDDAPHQTLPDGWVLDPIDDPREGYVHVSLEIENHYELYGTETTYRTRLEIPAPPEGDTSDDTWQQEYIYPETGVGHEDGDSSYFVKVTASSDPALVGQEFEFGL